MERDTVASLLMQTGATPPLPTLDLDQPATDLWAAHLETDRIFPCLLGRDRPALLRQPGYSSDGSKVNPAIWRSSSVMRTRWVMSVGILTASRCSKSSRFSPQQAQKKA